MVTRRVNSSVWTPVGPRVLILHTGHPTREQRWWAAVLHATPANGAHRLPDAPAVVLCGLSAAEAGGLTGFEASAVHVAVTHGRETEDLDHHSLRVRIHQTRHLTAADIHPTLLPPRLRLPRAVVESASDAALDRPGRARALIAAAVQQRLVRADELSACATSRRTLPGRRLLLETIADAQGGAHSLPESEFLRGLRAAGLPSPTRQRRLTRANGVWYLDNDFTEWLVAVEINGIQHYTQMLREADDFRRAVLQIGGRIVVDLSSYAVRHQIRSSLLLIAEVLRSHGWRPSTKADRVLAGYRRELGWVDDHLRAS